MAAKLVLNIQAQLFSDNSEMIIYFDGDIYINA